MPDPVNLSINLNVARRRTAISTLSLIRRALRQDAKQYSRNPPRAFLPIFPTDNAALQAALTLVTDRLENVLFSD